MQVGQSLAGYLTMTYVPLSQRSSKELRAQGETYRRMALTARTPVAKSGLESLAIRFAALAASREAEELLKGNDLRPLLPIAQGPG